MLRARIVLGAAQGTSSTRLSRDLGVHVDTVRKWRRRFCQQRLTGLVDRPRSGRPASRTSIYWVLGNKPAGPQP